MRIYNVVRHMDENLGDQYSTPVRYFDFLDGAELLDPNRGDFSGMRSPETAPDVIVVGGGGQIANRVPQYDQHLQIVAESAAISVAWAIGHNRHNDSSISYPSYLSNFDLVGLRDWPSPYPWLPDASCMHPALQAVPAPHRDVVLYEHWQIASGVEGLPTMRNSAKSVESVVSFLASAETVVTNTYHGWYWATLMARRVILVEPFSTKFNSLKYPPSVSDRDNWRAAASRARTYPQALDECREANLLFASQVRERCSL